MSHSEHPIHIAPYASNVHVHIYNYAPTQRSPMTAPTATATPSNTRVPHSPPLSRENTTFWPAAVTVANQNSIPTSTTASDADTPTEPRANDGEPSQRTLPPYLRMLQRLSTSDNRQQAPQRTAADQTSGGARVPRLTGFQQALSSSTSFQDLVSRLRQRGQQDGYTVSFELGTLGEMIRRGTSVEQLTTHTTLGLYQDLETCAEDDGDESKVDETECETCSICQEQFTQRCIVRQIDRCNHYFHQACIEKWLGDHTTCPLCMQEIVGQEEGRDTNASATGAERTERADINRVQERLLNIVADELGI